jgi:D-3-phosphoglycerate dehydrogenase / 2-oxoglutarate reductase
VPARVVVTDHPFPSLDVERQVLAALDAELELAPAADEATLTDLAHGADALLVCYAKVTPQVVAAAASGACRVIARYGIGVDNVPVEEATRAGIVVTNVPDYCLDEVADQTVALLLAAARGIVAGAAEVARGGWLPALPELGIRRLAGRRLALLGVGRIGRRVAERALALQLEVVGYDPFVRDWDLAGVGRAETLEDAVAEADFISLHAPLTPENRHMIGERTIALMRRAPVIVNTSRGGLVDTEAAVRALDEGRLTAVALDVTEPEPLPSGHHLRDHPRAIVTPHMAYYSVEAQEELQRRAAEEVVRALTGEPPRCPVNPEVLEGRPGA